MVFNDKSFNCDILNELKYYLFNKLSLRSDVYLGCDVKKNVVTL